MVAGSKARAGKGGKRLMMEQKEEWYYLKDGEIITEGRKDRVLIKEGAQGFRKMAGRTNLRQKRKT